MKTLLRIWLIMLAVLLIGCGTLSNGRRWGQDATLLPGSKRVGRAAVRAISSSGIWLPLSGAAALQIDHMDERVSDWASTHTPLFASQEGAEEITDRIRDAAGIVLCASVLATPSGDAPAEWVAAKAKGAAVDFAAVALTRRTVDLLKERANRRRPNGADARSFPSGNASSTAVRSTLAYRNLACTGLSTPGRAAVGMGLTGLSLLSGWGRVEAGAHYPSDVLVGLGLGHFIALFVQDAFLGLQNEPCRVEAARLDGGVQFGVTWEF